MACHEERHHLVTELLIAHFSTALFILGLKQHREQVAAVVAAGAAPGDDIRENALELADRMLDPAIQGRGNPVGRRDQARTSRDEGVHQGLHRRAGAGMVSPPISASNRVLATISRVSRIISAWASRTWLSSQDWSMRSV